MSAIASTGDVSVAVPVVDQLPKPLPVRRDNCTGHHWKWFAITLAPAVVADALGISSIILGVGQCQSPSNYAAGIALAVFALVFSIFSCIQVCCLPYVHLKDTEKDDPNAYCNGVIVQVVSFYAMKAFLLGLGGAIATGVIKNSC